MCNKIWFSSKYQILISKDDILMRPLYQTWVRLTGYVLVLSILLRLHQALWQYEGDATLCLSEARLTEARAHAFVPQGDTNIDNSKNSQSVFISDSGSYSIMGYVYDHFNNHHDVMPVVFLCTHVCWPNTNTLSSKSRHVLRLDRIADIGQYTEYYL